MRATIFGLILVLLCSPCIAGPTQGRQPVARWLPHLSAVRDWRFWAGEAIIAASVALDGKSTCDAFQRGFVETGTIQHDGHSCRVTAAQMVGAGAFYTTLNLFEHKYFVDPNDHAWRNITAFSVPVGAAAVHLSAAGHNWSLPDANGTASARARLAPGVN